MSKANPKDMITCKCGPSIEGRHEKTCPHWHDPVEHPRHYTSHPSGVEVITITEHLNFCVGNAVKYALRAGKKTADPTEDLRKAVWYLRREIARLEKSNP